MLPEDVRAADLDKAARGELRTLSKENADAVARHLVMAGRLIEDDPAEAHRHALAAARRAGRVAVVRESVAITAYAVGDFALALRELRTFRRISGSDDQIGLMVDSERGVGRPDRALELGRSVDRNALPAEAQVALAVAMSGARLDLADPRGALDELERVPADLQRVHPWTPVLFEALAAVHEDLGDAAAASLWSRRAERAESLLAEVDEEGSSVVVSTEEPEPVHDPAAADGGAADEVDPVGPRFEEAVEDESSLGVPDDGGLVDGGLVDGGLDDDGPNDGGLDVGGLDDGRLVHIEADSDDDGESADDGGVADGADVRSAADPAEPAASIEDPSSGPGGVDEDRA